MNTQTPGTQTGFYDISEQGGTPFAAGQSRSANGEPEPERSGNPTPERSGPSSPERNESSSPRVAPAEEPVQQPVLQPEPHPDQEAIDTPIPDEDDALASGALVSVAKKSDGKGAKELGPKKFDEAERQLFDKSDLKEITAWRDKQSMDELTEKDGCLQIKSSRMRWLIDRRSN